MEQRFGHMGESGKRILSKHDLLGGDKIAKLDFCEHWVYEKQYRVSFDDATHNTTGIVDRYLGAL